MTDTATESLAVTPAIAADGTGGVDSAAVDAGGWLDLLQPAHLATTLMLSMGVALFAFNGFFVSTVLPSAIAEIGGGHLIAWSVSLYLIGSIIAGVTAAQLKQRFGARLVLVVATLLFIAGTIVAAMATSMEQVLLGRVGQGLGEGVVAAICYALIPALFPARLVPKVFGVEALVWTCASFGGPFAAGWMAESFSWRMAFLINVPLGLLFILLALFTATRRERVFEGSSIPVSPLVLLSLGMLMVLSSGVVGQAPISAALVLLGLALLGFSVVKDRASASSLMPHSAFGFHSTVGTGLWLVLLMPVAQATSSVYFVFGLQHGFGFGPMAAGGLGAVMAMSWSLVAVLIAHIGAGSARRRAIEAGPALQCGGMILVALGFHQGSLALLIAGQVVVGAAFGASWAFLSQMLMEASAAEERDKTSGLIPTLQSAGFAIGAAFAGLAGNSLGLAETSGNETTNSAFAATFLIPVLWTVPAVLLARRSTRLAREVSRLSA
ncbi:MFS transporter [Rhizobium sp. 'Codium 1']|uniref:MFS transporter n=1 Tax=Rhizobium sp. 'Codium 1' TaxID=2940484 RepID=UPI001E56C3E1|nr:MFS transporter [Rhizobium sp. 'Codium 1']MCC8931066.1 MFS transporter [Rhizobium sp. 'Codium 1']